MEQELVQHLKGIQRGLAHLLVAIEPSNEDEWNAFERINAAHKQLRGVEYSKLGQLSLIPKEKEVECPQCKGTKLIKDGTGADAMCPKCNGQGVVPESALQAAMPLKENPESKEAFAALQSATEPPAWAKDMICAKCMCAFGAACVCAFEENRPDGHTLDRDGKVTSCPGYTDFPVKVTPEEKGRRRRRANLH